jgi:hypothetical protein
VLDGSLLMGDPFPFRTCSAMPLASPTSILAGTGIPNRKFNLPDRQFGWCDQCLLFFCLSLFHLNFSFSLRLCGE